MAKVLREFLGRCWQGIPSRAYVRAQEQRCGLFFRELLLGNFYSTRKQQTLECTNKHTERGDDGCSSGKGLPYRGNDTALQSNTQLAGRQTVCSPEVYKSRVYDILNCGPRQRFVVRGRSGVFIVHNCVQKIARSVLSDQMLAIQNRLQIQQRNDPEKIYKVVTTTHDEILCCIPAYWAQECLQMMEKEMGTAPAWCPGLPLKSSGGFAQNYGDCEK